MGEITAFEDVSYPFNQSARRGIEKSNINFEKIFPYISPNNLVYDKEANMYFLKNYTEYQIDSDDLSTILGNGYFLLLSKQAGPNVVSSCTGMLIGMYLSKVQGDKPDIDKVFQSPLKCQKPDDSYNYVIVDNHNQRYTSDAHFTYIDREPYEESCEFYINNFEAKVTLKTANTACTCRALVYPTSEQSYYPSSLIPQPSYHPTTPVHGDKSNRPTSLICDFKLDTLEINSLQLFTTNTPYMIIGRDILSLFKSFTNRGDLFNLKCQYDSTTLFNGYLQDSSQIKMPSLLLKTSHIRQTLEPLSFNFYDLIIRGLQESPSSNEITPGQVFSEFRRRYPDYLDNPPCYTIEKIKQVIL